MYSSLKWGKHHDQEAPQNQWGVQRYYLQVYPTGNHLPTLVFIPSGALTSATFKCTWLYNTWIRLLKLQLMELFTICSWSSGPMKQKTTHQSPFWFFWRWQKFRKKDIVRANRKEEIPQLWGTKQLFIFTYKEWKALTAHSTYALGDFYISRLQKAGIPPGSVIIRKTETVIWIIQSLKHLTKVEKTAEIKLWWEEFQLCVSSAYFSNHYSLKEIYISACTQDWESPWTLLSKWSIPKYTP